MDMEVGYIGVGMMGLPIALNLLKAGVRLRVFNRTASKAQALVANGAAQVGSPGDTAAPGGVVMTMLANDEAVEAMVGDEGLAARLAPGGIHVSMSTIAPASFALFHAERGSAYVASPVFVGPAMSPLALMPIARVFMALGASIVVNTPPRSRKPCSRCPLSLEV